MRYFVTMGTRVMEVELGPDGVRLDGELVDADMVEVDGTQVRTLLMNHRSHWLLANREGRGRWQLHLSGHPIEVEVVDDRTHAIREMTGQRETGRGPAALRAPMPGLVVGVEVVEGDEVLAGQGLVIVEAMKMENELKCAADARVSKVLVSPGQAVNKDEILVEFEAPEASENGGPEE